MGINLGRDKKSLVRGSEIWWGNEIFLAVWGALPNLPVSKSFGEMQFWWRKSTEEIFHGRKE